MRRRTLLSTLSTSALVGLAGCNALSGDSSTTRPNLGVETTPSESTTTTRPVVTDPGETPQPWTRTEKPQRVLAALDPLQVDDDVSVTAGFTNTATPDHPATLRITHTNTSDTETEFTFGGTPPLSRYVATDEATDNRLILAPVTDAEPTKAVRYWNDCWEPRFRIVDRDDETQSISLPPGKSVTHRYALVTPNDQTVCLPVGQYTVEAAAGWQLTISAFNPQDNQPGTSQFEGASVPPLPGEATGSFWYHEATAGDSSVYLRPGTEQLGLQDRPLSLTLCNYGTAALTFTPGEWHLYKRHEEMWKYIGPYGTLDGEALLRPGETDTMQVQLSNGSSAASETSLKTVGGLGPGRYAVERSRLDPTPRDGTSQRVAMAAMVQLVGDAPDLTPIGVTDTTRSGETLSVATEDGGNVTVAVERRSRPSATTLLTEQVMQFPILRNTLSYLSESDSLSRVDLQTTGDRFQLLVGSTMVLGLATDQTGISFGYLGESYRLYRPA
ncbi:hypothetical protein [Haloarchaeobius sp. DFWS5]|uniref:hypothetical protein n=1 Tax=Haloarchaeobius sp. DFWS5 TaxID=3446114 RepID=UPI003EBED890